MDAHARWLGDNAACRLRAPIEPPRCKPASNRGPGGPGRSHAVTGINHIRRVKAARVWLALDVERAGRVPKVQQRRRLRARPFAWGDVLSVWVVEQESCLVHSAAVVRVSEENQRRVLAHLVDGHYELLGAQAERVAGRI